MALADEIRKVLSDPMNLPPEFLSYIVQHGAQNPVPVQSLNAPTLIASGVGSTSNAPTRYVGGTTAGAPSSGTYVAGDFVVSHDGHIYVCTATGAPGTWSTWPAQGEIAYNSIISEQSVLSTSFASPTSIIGGSAVAYTGVSVYIEVFAPIVSVPNNAAGGSTSLLLMDSTSLVGSLGDVVTPVVSSPTVLAMPFYAQVKLTPSAGNHTYGLSAYASSTIGTPVVGASTGPPAMVPGFVRVRYA